LTHNRQGLPKRWLFSFIVLLAVSLTGITQKDTAYIQPLANRLVVNSFVTAKDFQVAFQSPTVGRLNFQNAGMNVGIRAKYKKIGLSLSLPLVSFNSPLEGNPKHFGVAINLYKPTYFVRAGLRRFRGFTQLDISPNRFREDIQMWHGIIRGFYVFNYPRFSLRSSFKLSERQKRNQGSWLLSGLLSTQILRADSLLIPTRDNQLLVLNGYRSYKMGLGGGYAYTLTHKKWFLTVMATIGGEFRRIQFVGKGEIENRTQWRLSPRINTQASGGYNGRSFFVTLNGFDLPGTDFTEELNVRVIDQRLTLMIGWRFQAFDTFDDE